MVGKNAYGFQGYLAQDTTRHSDYDGAKSQMLRRYFIPIGAFLLGSVFIASIYFGLLTWAQGWDSALNLFQSNRGYIVPIWISFGVQAALYVILRFRLFVPTTSTSHTGALMGTSGGTSVTAMVACCLHHVTDVLPVLGVSAAATFLTRYQRPFMLVGLGMNLVGIIVMLIVLYREYKKSQPLQNLQPALEIK
jgi:hypothetical protein